MENSRRHRVEYKRAWWANRTPEQREQHRTRGRKYQALRRSEKTEEINAAKRETAKCATPEQRENRRAYMREWYRNASAEKKAKLAESSHRRWRELPEENKEARKVSRNAHAKVYGRVENHRRRAALKAGGSYSPKEWQELIDRCDHKCMSCRRREPEIKLTVDHIEPLSKGGKNAIDNIQPLCKFCNSAKGKRTINYLEARVSDGER